MLKYTLLKRMKPCCLAVFKCFHSQLFKNVHKVKQVSFLLYASLINVLYNDCKKKKKTPVINVSNERAVFIFGFLESSFAFCVLG